jgi:hypothetical protein
MAYGFIPIAWRQVKVTFIPKPGKLGNTEAKTYRPIILSSFLLKTMEKLVDRHILCTGTTMPIKQVNLSKVQYTMW